MEGQLGGWLISLIIGGVGGNIAGAQLKNYGFGRIGNTIAGALGGLGGQILASRLSGGGLCGNLVGSVIGSALVMIVVGLFVAATD